MATQDTVVQELVVNTLTQAQFDAAKEAGTLSPYELYGTPDASVRLPVLTPMWFDHITNDVSWLRADTFSWQSGDVYVAAYEHLVADYENAESETLYAWGNNLSIYFYTLSESPSVGDSVYTSSGRLYSSIYVTEVADGGIYVGGDNKESTLYRRDSSRDTEIPQTDTIGSITITYYLAEDGHKICLPDQESNLSALYEQTGVAWYYILDTDNKQFKLPRSKHNKYASTVPVVGNGMNLGLTDGSTNIGFGFKTQDQSLKGRTDFYGKDVGTYGGLGGVASAAVSGYSFGVTTDPEKSGIVAQQVQDTDQYKYLYFYVGNFERDAIEQTAGLNAELFNGKADSDLKNIPANYDYVVDSQLPTAENGYIWYRKYKSGWVEQGGVSSGLNAVVTLPVEMADTNYSLVCSGVYATRTNTGGASWSGVSGDRTSTTTITLGQAAGFETMSWQVSGMAA